ncbi:MAG: hypothetical protein QOF15_391, partial [Mycobacterium sp.]|nr:hypothetical protein [Mycobacterium sp.]
MIHRSPLAPAGAYGWQHSSVTVSSGRGCLSSATFATLGDGAGEGVAHEQDGQAARSA